MYIISLFLCAFLFFFLGVSVGGAIERERLLNLFSKIDNWEDWQKVIRLERRRLEK